MPPLAFCGECGQKLLEGKPFCGECGHNNAGGVVAPAKTGGGGGGNNVGSKAKVCGGCNGSLEGVLRFMVALDKEWHPECFVCSQCRSDFKGGKFFVHDGMLVCDNCTRNVGPKCAGCNQPCGETYVSALNKMWHHACLVCSGCSKPLSGGAGFISRNDKLFCESSCANRTLGGVQAATNTARPAVQTSVVSPNRPTAQVSAANVVKAQTAKPAETSCFACSRNAGKAFCPECGKKLGGVAANPNQQREQQQREQQQREQQQREQQQREQQQREQQQREQQQREQRQREQQQREQQQKDQRDREQQAKRDQPKPQATPAKNLFCGECGTKLAGPGFCPECGHNNGASVSSRPAGVKSYQPPDSPEAPGAPPMAPGAPPMAPGAPPMAPGGPPMAPGGPPMAPGGPPMAPSVPSGYGSSGGKAGSSRGDLLAQINAGKKLKKAPKVAERGADGLPVGFTEGGSSGSGAGGAKKTGGGASGGGRGGPMDMQAQLAAKLAARNK